MYAAGGRGIEIVDDGKSGHKGNKVLEGNPTFQASRNFQKN
jgi:hypothetical protein